MNINTIELNNLYYYDESDLNQSKPKFSKNIYV